MAAGSGARALRAWLVGALVLGTGGMETAAAQVAAAQETGEGSGAAADPLRLLRAAPGRTESAGSPAVLRSRRVALQADPRALGDAVVLDLFDDVSIAAFREERAGHAPDRATVWRGRVPGRDSRVTLVTHDGVLAGTVRLEGALYRILPDADGALHVEQLDEAALPGCGSTESQGVTAAQTPGETSFGSPATPAIDTSADAGGTRVDVLVVYTPQARAAMGSAAAVEALVDLAVVETNEAYVDSGVGVWLDLVHVAEVGYDESGDFQTDLARLQNANDEYLSEVQELREIYGADLVSMIVASGQYCGIAYVMTNPGPFFANYAFSVVSRGCATGYYSFGHELGHNMGCQHDHEHTGNGAFPYSFGHHNSTGSWRTIMAYAPGTRIQFFSNPEVEYLDEPTGTPTTDPQPANNAQSINEVADIVAGFREPAIAAYGWGKETSAGQIATLSWEGLPSAASGGGCSLVLTHAVPGQLGIVHRGPEPAELPFRGGTLWVQGPVVGVRSFWTGTDGVVVHPLPASPGLVGTTHYFQFFFRDPAQSDGTYIGMTNGVKVTYLP